MHFVDNPDFHRSDADQLNLSALPVIKEAISHARMRGDALVNEVLSAEMESNCFRAMNYLLFKASQMRVPCPALLTDAQSIRDFIIVSNMRLIGHIAGKIKTRVSCRCSSRELMSEGSVALLRCVELFDLRAGTRFATYAWRAIESRMGRASWLIRRFEKKERQFAELDSDSGESSMDFVEAPDESGIEEQADESMHLRELLKVLDERSRRIIEWRFGFGRAAMGREEIADKLGLTYVRVQQLEELALLKLYETHGTRLEAEAAARGMRPRDTEVASPIDVLAARVESRTVFKGSRHRRGTV